VIANGRILCSHYISEAPRSLHPQMELLRPAAPEIEGFCSIVLPPLTLARRIDLSERQLVPTEFHWCVAFMNRFSWRANCGKNEFIPSARNKFVPRQFLIIEKEESPYISLMADMRQG
jgi:hypothetical protein